MSEVHYWIDGEPAVALPLPDRGLDFGDGLFETLLYAQGRLYYLNYHMQRLERGLTALGLPGCTLNAARSQLAGVLEELAQTHVSEAILRLTITRGSGPRGYLPPENCQPRIIINAIESDSGWQQLMQPAQLGVALTHWSRQSQLAGIKHLNRLEQVLAARERLATEVDELVMLDQDREVISVISGNIFAICGGKIITPALLNCGIRGTRRQLLMDSWAPDLGMELQQQVLSITDLKEADELFYTNAVLGLRPVASLEEREWNAHPVCEALHSIYCGQNS